MGGARVLQAHKLENAISCCQSILLGEACLEDVVALAGHELGEGLVDLGGTDRVLEGILEGLEGGRDVERAGKAWHAGKASESLHGDLGKLWEGFIFLTMLLLAVLASASLVLADRTAHHGAFSHLP
jgi:hypothetical protein